MKVFCEQLKNLRMERRIYQREAAEHLGVNMRACQNHECGQSEPNIGRLIALAGYSGVTLDYLTGRTYSRT
ncbi:MAG: helix-turn-helix transcriptional regulator [Oscillospiraceae bacterium]|nr:helix-turn-helix transcriptional regulator [Oscillospiraceae bacterium]